MVPTAAPLLRRYLLGDLPEPDAETLERQYFADPDVLDRVWEAENELVDDYVRGRLELAERERFERHYLASPRHRDRVRAARALWAASPPAAIARPRRSWVAPAGLAAGLLVAAAGLVWWLRPPPPAPIVVQAPSPAPSAVPVASPDPLASAPSPVVATFTLSAILVRGGEQPRVRIPPGTDEVVLRLRGEPLDGRRLTFAVRTVEGATVVSGPTDRSGAPSPSRIATVRLPASRLPPGDYILALSASGEAEPVQQYFFRVSSR